MKKTKASPRKARRQKKPRTDIILLVNVPKLVRFLVLVAMCVLALVSVVQVVKHVLPLRSFSVQGISVYESVEIVNASGLKLGELLYEIDTEKVEQRILERCPYLSSVKVRAVFPTELRISVVGRNPRWYIDVAGSKYALDGNLVVLDEIGDTAGLTQLILPNVKSVLTGSVPRFGESETEIKKTLEIIDEIRKTGFQLRLTKVDLTSRWDIEMEVDGSYRIVVGDASDLSAKLMAAEDILTNRLPSGCVGGELDVSLPQNPAFKPIYSSSETPSEE